jgi:hypothetical protein
MSISSSFCTNADRNYSWKWLDGYLVRCMGEYEDYAIDGDRIRTPKQLNWWLDHLAHKLWITKRDLVLVQRRWAERYGIDEEKHTVDSSF